MATYLVCETFTDLETISWEGETYNLGTDAFNDIVNAELVASMDSPDPENEIIVFAGDYTSALNNFQNYEGITLNVTGVKYHGDDADKATVTLKTFKNNGIATFANAALIADSVVNDTGHSITFKNGTFVNSTFTGAGTVILGAGGLADGSQILGGNNDVNVNAASITLGKNTTIDANNLFINKSLTLAGTASLSTTGKVKFAASQYLFVTGVNQINFAKVDGASRVSVSEGGTLVSSVVGSTVYFGKNTYVLGENTIDYLSVKGSSADPEAAAYRKLTVGRADTTTTLNAKVIQLGASATSTSGNLDVVNATVVIADTKNGGVDAEENPITLPNGQLNIAKDGAANITAGSDVTVDKVYVAAGAAVNVDATSTLTLTDSLSGTGLVNVAGTIGSAEGKTFTNKGKIVVVDAGDVGNVALADGGKIVVGTLDAAASATFSKTVSNTTANNMVQVLNGTAEIKADAIVEDKDVLNDGRYFVVGFINDAVTADQLATLNATATVKGTVNTPRGAWIGAGEDFDETVLDEKFALVVDGGKFINTHDSFTVRASGAVYVKNKGEFTITDAPIRGDITVTGESAMTITVGNIYGETFDDAVISGTEEDASATVSITESTLTFGDADSAVSIGHASKATRKGALVLDAATVNGKAFDVMLAGTVSASKGTTIDVTGTINNAGAISIVADGTTLKADAIANAENASITIDATGYTGGIVKVIDLNQDKKLDKVTVYTGDTGAKVVYGDDGDVVIHDYTFTDVYVNADWAEDKQVGDAIEIVLGEESTVTAYYGINAFASVQKAYTDGAMNGTTTTVLKTFGTDKSSPDYVEILVDTDGAYTLTGGDGGFVPYFEIDKDGGAGTPKTTLTIDDADIMIQKFGARRNALVTVTDSVIEINLINNNDTITVYNNGTEIITDSVIWTMQTTVEGVITVSGEESKYTNTWQTSVWYNGQITVSDRATWNTAAFQVGGTNTSKEQKYIDRKNPDIAADAPATFIVDGAILDAGYQIKSKGDADYSYNTSYGIEVGTFSAAKFDILNDSVATLYTNGSAKDAEIARTIKFGEYAIVTVEESELNIGGKNVDAASFSNVGSLTLSNGATLNATIAAVNSGKIALDVTSTITGTTLDNASGTITIDATGFAANTVKKVIDLSQTTALTNVELTNVGDTGAKVAYGSDGDVVVHNIALTNLYVNSDWTGYKEGETFVAYQIGDAIKGETGKYYGINAFSTMKAATDAANSNAGATITIGKIGDSELNTDIKLTTTGEYTITGGNMTDAAAPALLLNGVNTNVTINSAILTLGKVRGGKDEAKPVANYTFDKLTISDSIIAPAYYAGAGGGWWTFYDNTLTITNSIVGAWVSKDYYKNLTAEQLTAMKNGASATTAAGLADVPYGDNYSGQHLGLTRDLTVTNSTLTTGFFHVQDRGTATLSNTLVYVGGSLLAGYQDDVGDSNEHWGMNTSPTDYNVGGTATISFTNGTIVRNIGWGNGNSGSGLRIGGNQQAGIINVTGSQLLMDVGENKKSEDVYVYSNGALNITNGTVSGRNISNAGSFTVSGTSTIKAGTLTGKAIEVAAGSTIKDSTVGGTTSISLLGKATFTGANTISGLAPKYYDAEIVVDSSKDENSLTVTTNRMSLGYGLQFNVTGGIENALAVEDKTNEFLTLDYQAGFSITGGGDHVSNLKVTNAYAKIGNTSSKDKDANSTYNLNFVNSIVDFTNQLCFTAPTSESLKPVMTTTIDASAVTISSHLKNNVADSKITVKNGGILTVNGSFQQLGGTLEVLAGSTFDGKYYTNSSHGGQTGTITVDGAGATFNLKTTKADQWQNSGTVSVLNGAKMDVTYTTNAGAITIDTASLLTGTALTNTETGTITIDATKLAADSYVKVIDLDQGSALTGVSVLGDAHAVYGADGDVVVTNITVNKVYVNDAWAGKEFGDKINIGTTEAPVYVYYGINAFDTFKPAYDAVDDNGTITICSEVVDGSGLAAVTYKSLTFQGTGNIDLDEPLQINGTWTVNSKANVGFEPGDWTNGLNIRSGGKLAVTGGATADVGYLINRGDIEVSADATLKIYYGLLYGRKPDDGDASQITVDNAQIVFDSNSYNLEGHFGNTTAAGGVTDVVLTNGKITALDTVTPGLVFDSTATLTATGTSEITAATKIENKGELNLSSTKLTAGTTLTNTGTINAYAGSTISATGLFTNDNEVVLVGTELTTNGIVNNASFKATDSVIDGGGQAGSPHITNGLGGTMELTNSIITTGAFIINSYGTSISLDNSTLDARIINSKEITAVDSTIISTDLRNEGGKFVVSGDSTLNVKLTNGTIDLENATLTATTVTGEGNLSIAAKYVKTPAVPAQGVEGEEGYVAGSDAVLGDNIVTFKGENTINAITNAGTLKIQTIPAVEAQGVEGEEGYVAGSDAVAGKLTAGEITNNGTITIDATSTLSATSIANNGTITAIGTSTIDADIVNANTVNFGTEDAALVTTYAKTLTGRADINGEGTNVTLTGTMQGSATGNTGTLLVNEGATLTVEDDGVVKNYGTLIFWGDIVFEAGSQLLNFTTAYLPHNTGTLEFNGTADNHVTVNSRENGGVVGTMYAYGDLTADYTDFNLGYFRVGDHYNYDEDGVVVTINNSTINAYADLSVGKGSIPTSTATLNLNDTTATVGALQVGRLAWGAGTGYEMKLTNTTITAQKTGQGAQGTVIIDADNTLTMDTDSQIKFFGTWTNEGTLSVNVDGKTGAYCLVDYTGKGSMTLEAYGTVEFTGKGSEDFELQVIDNDLWAVNTGSSKVLYVNNTWTTYEYSDPIDGREGLFFELNAFNNAASAIAAMGPLTTNLKFENNNGTSEYTLDGYTNLTQSLTIDSDAEKTALVGAEVRFGVDTDTPPNADTVADPRTFTINGNVEFDDMGTGKYGDTTLNINGNVTVRHSAWFRANTHTIIAEDASFKRAQSGNDGQLCVYGTVDVLGTLDYYTEGSMGTTLRIGSPSYTLPGILNVTGSAASLNIHADAEGKNYYAPKIESNGFLNVKEGATATFSGEVKNEGTITVSGESTLTASKITNSGSFIATGTADAKATVIAAIDNDVNATVEMTDVVFNKITDSVNKGEWTVKDSSLTSYSVTNYDAKSTFSAEDSTITMTRITNNGSFVVDGGAINTKKLQNAGIFMVGGEATLNVGELTGTINVLDGAELTAIITGAEEADSAVVFDGKTTGITLAAGSVIDTVAENYGKLSADDLQVKGLINGIAATESTESVKGTITAATLTADSIVNNNGAGTNSGSSIELTGDLEAGVIKNGVEAIADEAANNAEPGNKAFITAANITADSITNFGTIGSQNPTKTSIEEIATGDLNNGKYGNVFATTLTADSIENDGEIVVNEIYAGSINNKASGENKPCGVIAVDTGSIVIEADEIINSGYIKTNGGSITADAITNNAYNADTKDGLIWTDSITADGTVTNYGKINVDGTLTANRVENKGGEFTVNGKSEIEGNVVVDGGEVTFNDDVTAANLNTRNASAKININDATVSVAGTIYYSGTIVATNSVLDGSKFSGTGTLKVVNSFIDGIKLNHGTMQLDTMSLADVTIDGAFDVVDDSDFSGVNAVEGLTVSEGANLTISAAATIAAKDTQSLTVTGGIVNNGTITIDATGLSWGSSWNSLQVVAGAVTNSGTIIVENAENTMAIVQEGGIYLYKVEGEFTTDTLCVNAAWTGKAVGDKVTYGEKEYVFGMNAFATVGSIVFYADTTNLVIAAGDYDDNLVWAKDGTTLTLADGVELADVDLGAATITGDITANEVTFTGDTTVSGAITANVLNVDETLAMDWSNPIKAVTLNAAPASIITIDLSHDLETVGEDTAVIATTNVTDFSTIVADYALNADIFKVVDGDLKLNAAAIGKVFSTSKEGDGYFTTVADAVSDEATTRILIESVASGTKENIYLNGKRTQVLASAGSNLITTKNTFAAGVDVSLLPATESVTSDCLKVVGTKKNPAAATNLTIDGGKFTGYVLGADMVKLATGEEEVEFHRFSDVNLTINGGTFAPVSAGADRAIAGGLMFAISGSDKTGSARIVGDINLTITGGSFKGYDIYGGNYANNSKFLGSKTSIKGDIVMTLDATENKLVFANNDNYNAGIVTAGSYGPSYVEGNTTVILTGDQGIEFEQLIGGCSGDMHTINEKTGKWDNESYVTGNRTLSFTGFSGDLAFNKIQDFNTVSFEGANEINFDGEFHRYFNDDVKSWYFADAEDTLASLSGSVVFDFSGDTINLEGCASGFELSFDNVKNGAEGIDLSKVVAGLDRSFVIDTEKSAYVLIG